MEMYLLGAIMALQRIVGKKFKKSKFIWVQNLESNALTIYLEVSIAT
jgi:hypothetical protein